MRQLHFPSTLIGALIAFFLILGGASLSIDPDGVTGGELLPGSARFHYFKSTDTETTADSGLFQWDKCASVSFKIDNPSGAAGILIMECSEKSKTGDCEVFTCDVDGDGIITAVDETTVFDGSVGLRGCRGIRPSSRWGWIDVQSVPSSQGDARVSIVCHTS